MEERPMKMICENLVIFRAFFPAFRKKHRGFAAKWSIRGETRWNKTNRNFWMAWCISSARSAVELLYRTGQAGTGNSAPMHAADCGGITTRCRNIGSPCAKPCARSAGRNTRQTENVWWITFPDTQLSEPRKHRRRQNVRYRIKQIKLQKQNDRTQCYVLNNEIHTI